MKCTLVQSVSGVIVMFGLFACSSVPKVVGSVRPAAIAIVMDGGGVPSMEQTAEVHARMRSELAKMGYVLAASPRLAEVIVHVKFTPEVSGGAGGRISILNAASNVNPRQQAMAARDEFKEASAKAVRSQTTEPR